MSGPEIAYAHHYSGAVRPITAELLSAVYLAPRQTSEFDLAAAIERDSASWPWSESYSVARTETLASIARSLRELMSATNNLDPDDVDLSALDPGSRVYRHADALKLLWLALGGALPDDLWVIRHVLQSKASDALEPLPIIADAGLPRARIYQRLLQTLESHHGRAAEDAQVRWLETRDGQSLRADPASLLGHVQRHMLSEHPGNLSSDGSVSSFAVRDSAMEADLAASMIQRGLQNDPQLEPSDFGLLIPATADYQRLTAASFRRAGIPLSGLTPAPEQRDLASEVVYLFLLARRIPPPAMAIASLTLSPLMPWDQPTGLSMAKAIMDGRDTWRMASALDVRAARLFTLLRTGGASHPPALASDLAILSAGLTAAEEHADDVKATRELIARLQSFLQGANPFGAIAWDTLLPMSAPAASVSTSNALKTTGGVTVMSEGEMPWRPVRHLFVMGFADGAYPAPVSANPFFLDTEIQTLRERCGIVLPSRADILAERIALFQSQIGIASDSLTLLCPQRSLDGKVQSSASTLPFITRCIAGIVSPEDFVLACDEIGEAAWPERIPQMLETKSLRFAPAEPPVDSINMRRDLFSIRKRDDGSSRPQSPSRLETLIVSPFAWLLSELDAIRSSWEPETVDVMKKGTIAHDVFEQLFVPDAELPSDDDISDKLPGLVEQCIRRTAPFMMGSHWNSERQTLQAEIDRAARNWRKALIVQGAKVINNEFWLKGHVLGIDIHGKADCLLQFDNGQLVIVDHKKSGTKNREARLNAGWDLQVELYKLMAATRPDPQKDDPDDANTKTRTMLADANSIGVAYHLMNDSGILLNAAQVSKVDATIAQIDKNISVNALAKLSVEIERLRLGEIKLNRTEDRKFFRESASMGLYAFDISPLVDLYSVAAEIEDEDAEDE